MYFPGVIPWKNDGGADSVLPLMGNILSAGTAYGSFI